MNLELIKKSKSTKAIILGSGVSVFENKNPLASIPYSEITGWPLGKVKGHKGVLDVYENLWVLRGRAHLYEGFSWEQACFPTKFLIEHGITELIATNSAGGVNPNFEIGDLMQITGYLDFLKPGKARGNLESLVKPIVKFETKLLSDELVHRSSSEGGTLRMHSGNYIGVHGPNYETDAEIALFRKLGADAVGMSTIPEIETTINAGIKITAVSIITNVYGKTEDLGHEGVLDVAKKSSKKLTELLGIS